MVPKRIIYAWFGRGQMSTLEKECIESWKRHCPDYEFMEVNEKNFDIHMFRYAEQAYKQGKWAYVADVAKIYYLHELGGIMVDTDCFMFQNPGPLHDLPGFAGVHYQGQLENSMMGLPAGSSFLKRMLNFYSNADFNPFTPINWITVNVLNDYFKIESIRMTHYSIIDIETGDRICVFDTPKLTARGNNYQLCLEPDTVAVHMFAMSWLTEGFNAIVRDRMKEVNLIYLENILKKIKVEPIVVDDRVYNEDDFSPELIKNLYRPNVCRDKIQIRRMRKPKSDTYENKFSLGEDTNYKVLKKKLF